MDKLDISTEECIIERNNNTLIVKLNRPQVRNALSSSMLIGLYKAWQLLKNDNTLACVVLTGNGGNFCSGMDLKVGESGESSEEMHKLMQEIPDIHWQAMLKVKRPLKPIILAVEGYALAGGTEITLGTDLRVCAESAEFGITETQRGLFPLGGSTVRLRRQIPYVRAAEALILGNNIKANEALEWGIVNKVVPDGQALAEALKIAQHIETLAPLAVRAMIKSLRENELMPESEALQAEEAQGWKILSTKDAKEGMKAFAEKRKPVFDGT